jgi:hypothetical protein
LLSSGKTLILAGVCFFYNLAGMAWVWDIRLKAFSEKKVEAKTCLVSERKKSHRGADFIHPAGFDPLQNMADGAASMPAWGTHISDGFTDYLALFQTGWVILLVEPVVQRTQRAWTAGSRPRHPGRHRACEVTLIRDP